MLKTFKYRPLAALLAFAIISSPACGSLIDRKQRTLSSHGMRLSSTVTAIDEGTDTYATTDASYVVIESNGNTFITPIIVPAANDSASLDLSHPKISAYEPGTEITVIPETGGCIGGSGCYAPLPDLNSSHAAQPAPTPSTTSASASVPPTPEYSGRGSGGSNLPPFEPSQPWPSPSGGDNDQPANQAPSPIPAPPPEVTYPQVPTNIDPPVVYVPNIPSPKNDQPDIPTYASANSAASVAMTAALATLNALQQQITDKLAKLVAESSSLLGDGRAVRQKQPVAEQGPLAPKDYPFKTPVDSPDGQRLAEAWQYQKIVSSGITASDPRSDIKRKLTQTAAISFHEADDNFATNDAHLRTLAEASLKFGLMALDVAVSLSPYGWAKDTYESITGNSMITGEELGAVGRGAAIIGVSLTIGLAFIAPEAVPMVGLLAKIIRKVDKGEKFEKALVAAGKLEKAIESLPAGLKVQRVRAGVDSERVAIVGRSMGDADRGLIGVNDAAAHFEAQGIKVETFKPTKAANEEFNSAIRAYKRETGSAMLPPDKVAQTTTFKENKEWIEKIRDSGSTVLDLGNPNGLNTPSSFYDMETSILWKN